MQHVLFCGWLLSVSIMFMRFIHSVAFISISSYCWAVSHCIDIPHFICLFTSWWTLGLFPIFCYWDQSWVFIGRTDIEAETPILWRPDAKSWLTGKDPDAGKDRRQGEKGTTEDEIVGWHHRLNGHGFGWTPGVCGVQGGLACCGSWGRKESDTTERLN